MAVLDLAAGAWQVEGSITDLRYTPDLRRALPAELAPTQSGFENLRARADLTFTASRDVQAGTPIRFSVSGRLSSGRLADARLQHPLTDITAERLRCTNDGWEVRNLRANHGEASLQVDSAFGSGYSADSPVSIQGSITNFTLTQGLIEKLPATLQATWQKYRPLGLMDAAFGLAYDGRRWSAATDIKCQSVSLACEKFPYPLQRAQGKVVFRQDQQLDVDLWASAGKTPIHVKANVAKPGPDWHGVIAIKSNGLLPVDETLIESLKPSVREVMYALQARGRVSVDARYERNAGEKDRIVERATIDVADGFVRYQDFPYPLQRVRGRLEMHGDPLRGDTWLFQDFKGENDSCYVTCNGQWTPLAEGGNLDLKFVATDVPCDDELRDSLAPGPLRLWQGLRPTGTIDHIEIDFKHRTGAPRPDVDIVLNQYARKSDPERRSLVIQPTWFPYRMERVTGAVKYQRDGLFWLNNIRAQHGTVELATRGDGVFQQDGSWRVLLQRLTVDRLRADRELLAALPRDLGDALTQMKFSGLMALDGPMSFFGTSDPNEPVTVNWDLKVDVDDGHLTVHHHEVQDVFGEINVKGTRNGVRIINWGELNLDYLLCKGIKLTRLRGPWWMDQTRLVFGQQASQDAKQQAPQSLQAEVFGGSVAADGVISLGPEGSFQLAADLKNADVTLVAEEFQSPTQITGLADAQLRLAGSAQGSHTLNGAGGVQLTQANIYRLPAIISLLNEMRVRETGPNVFNSSNVDFRIQHNRFYFDRFDLHGASLTLKGQGEMGFDRRINLDFYTILGGENRWLPVVRPLLGEASRQFMKIRVTGSLDSPHMFREVLPGLNFQQAFPDQTSDATGDAPDRLPLSARRWGLMRQR